MTPDKARELIAKRVASGLPAQPLADFISRRKGYSAPKHLRSLMRELEKGILLQSSRVMCSMPPRHGKTVTATSAVAWMLKYKPELRILYLSYNLTIAKEFTRSIRNLCHEVGVRLVADAKAVGNFKTPEGGEVIASGFGTAITGKGYDVIIVDDYLKGHAASESFANRELILNTWRSDVVTRCEPGCSVFIIATRWHVDDLAGQLLKEDADLWTVINYPAINDAGEALWPERMPVAELEKRRQAVGVYVWESLYQGRPYSRGGSLFGDAVLTDSPGSGECVIGVDFAYSAKSRSDYSVAVVMRGDGTIVDVLRRQCKIAEFEVLLAALVTTHNPTGVHAYIGGQEGAILEQFTRVKITAKPAVQDKYIRAQGYAAAWNAGKVRLSSVNTTAMHDWREAFVQEHVAFTGAAGGARNDDQIDASVAAWDALGKSGSVGVVSVGKREWGGKRWT